MTIDELIARLEAATEGSRELDCQIARDVVGLQIHQWPDWYRATAFDGRDDAIHLIPFYTTSLDAATTLVPDGWGGEIFWHDGSTVHRAFVDLRLPNPRWKDPDCPPEEMARYAALVDSYEDDDERTDTRGKPLALALCIAALKARRAGVESADG